MTRRPPRHTLLAGAALALVLLATGACSRPERVEAKETRPSVPAVAVVKATRGDLARELELAAEFRPYQEIDLHAIQNEVDWLSCTH